MISKKKIVAIVLFLLFGLSIFTFANPVSELEKVEKSSGNKTTTTTKPVVNNDNNQVIATNTDNETNVVNNGTNNDTTTVEENNNSEIQVEVVDFSGLKESIKNANDLIKDLESTTDENLKELLDKLIEEVKKGNNIINNENSKQEEVDIEKSVIDILIDTIKNIRFTVEFIDFDGSLVARASVKVGGSVKAPSVNERAGYVFVKWDKETDHVVSNMVVNAIYEYSKDTKYAVNYYFEEIDGTYSKDEELSKILEGTTNDEISVNPKEVFGFELASESVLEGTINADGSSVLDVYYNRVVNNVVFTINNKEYKTVAYKYGEKIVAPEYTAKEGYNFSGWELHNYNMGVNELSFNATEKIKKYTVTFFVDGILYATQIVNYNDDVDLAKIANPYKLSLRPDAYTYKFNSWVGNTTNIKANTVLTAKFDRIPKSYKVKYVMDDNTLIKEFDVKYGNNVPTLNENPTKEGYVFVGYNNSAKVVTRDLVFKAVFTPSTDTKYYVSYYLETEDGYKFDKTLERKGTTNSTVDFSKESKTGYVLNTKLSDLNGTITADGKAQFNLYFDLNENNKYNLIVKKEKLNGEYDITTTPVSAKTFATINYEAPAIKGYVLDENASILTTQVNVAGNSAIVVVYNLKESNVKFTINNKEYKTVTYKYGEKVVAPEYTVAAGKDFSGWNVKDLVMGDKDITLNATLSNHKYTITFMVDDTVYATAQVEYGEDVDTSKVANPTKESTNTTVYTFERWNGDLRKIHKDTTLVAHFRESERKYEVKFVNPDETVIKTDQVSYEGNAVAPVNPSYNNYKFVKWDKDYSKVTKNMTVTAIYQSGIKVVEEPNVQFQFEKGSKPDLGKLINVYEVYTNGDKKEVTNYTTDINTSKVVEDKVLTISQNGFTNTDIKYTVVDFKAFQTKFEVDFNNSGSYKASRGTTCSNGCDVNTNSVSMNHNFLEITEHYDELVSISKVEVIYADGSKANLKMSDMVRYSNKVTKGSIFNRKNEYFNPVYIGTLEVEETYEDTETKFGWIETDGLFGGYYGWYDVPVTKTRTVETDVQTAEKAISKVVIYYNRTGYGNYKITFKNQNGTFKAIDEDKIG